MVLFLIYNWVGIDGFNFGPWINVGGVQENGNHLLFGTICGSSFIWGSLFPK
jgi:hypothetical protein